MKSTISFLLVLFLGNFCIHAQNKESSESSFTSILINYLAAPGVYYEISDTKNLSDEISDINSDFPTSDRKSGRLKVDENGFKNQSHIYVGFSNNVNTLTFKNFQTIFNIYFDISKYDIKFSDSFDNGWGGQHGYTGEVETKGTYETKYLIDFQFKYTSNENISPFLSLSLKNLNYDIEVDGKKWFYQYAGQTSVEAKLNTSSEKFSNKYSGNISMAELGIGIGLVDDNRKQLSAGFKKNINSEGSSFFLVFVWEFI